MRKEQRAMSHSGSRERRFGAGVAATDNDDIEFRWEVHRGANDT
jgi:hypothetical protein